jgi:hypothetical protein
VGVFSYDLTAVWLRYTPVIMKTLRWIAAVLVLANCHALARDLTSVTLGKALAAMERGRSSHDEAEHFCSVQNKHEIDWGQMERRVRELANAQPEPKASDMFEVLADLRAARQALFRDFLGCAIKSDDARMASSQDAMAFVDDSAEELEKSIQDQVQKLESSAAKVNASSKRMRDAVKGIAEDVDKLYSRQPKVYVPDFPADLTALRTAYDDLLVATRHEELLKDAP